MSDVPEEPRQSRTHHELPDQVEDANRIGKPATGLVIAMVIVALIAIIAGIVYMTR